MGVWLFVELDVHAAQPCCAALEPIESCNLRLSNTITFCPDRENRNWATMPSQLNNIAAFGLGSDISAVFSIR